MEILLHCVLQCVMPYYEGYKHACNPNEESTTRVPTQWPTTYVTSILVTRMRILQCVLQGVMPYNVGYKRVCSPNGDPTMRVTSVTPYNEY